MERVRDMQRQQLSGPQMTRVRLAKDDLTAAREADLAPMEPAALILLVERLRGALDDTLRLVDELSCETQDP